MKKILIFLFMASLSLYAFNQVTVSGKGTPINPLIIIYTAHTDTVIWLTSPISLGQTNGVISISDHWSYASGTTSKVIPIECPPIYVAGIAYPADSMAMYMAFDTTKCIITPQAYNRRNIGFDAQFIAPGFIGLQFKMLGVSKVNHRIIIIKKSLQ